MPRFASPPLLSPRLLASPPCPRRSLPSFASPLPSPSSLPTVRRSSPATAWTASLPASQPTQPTSAIVISHGRASDEGSLAKQRSLLNPAAVLLWYTHTPLLHQVSNCLPSHPSTTPDQQSERPFNLSIHSPSRCFSPFVVRRKSGQGEQRCSRPFIYPPLSWSSRGIRNHSHLLFNQSCSFALTVLRRDLLERLSVAVIETGKDRLVLWHPEREYTSSIT